MRSAWVQLLIVVVAVIVQVIIFAKCRVPWGFAVVIWAGGWCACKLWGREGTDE